MQSVGIYGALRSSSISRGSLSKHSLDSDDSSNHNDNNKFNHHNHQEEEEEVEWLEEDKEVELGGFAEEVGRRSFSQYTALITRRYGQNSVILGD